MKRIALTSYISIIYIFGIPGAVSADNWYTEGNFSPTKRIRISVTNPLPIPRPDCPITILRTQLPYQNIPQREISVVDPSLPSNPEPTREELMKIGGYLARKETNGHFLEYQMDDIDKDGIWDELFFMSDLEASETKTFYLYIGSTERGLYEHKTHAGIGYYGRHMVPFWESEYIGWKLWFPGEADLHGKREPMLTAYPEYSTNLSGYYMPYEYGTDIMRVASTFGAGGICIFDTPSHPDSLSRPRYSPESGKGPIFDTRFSFDVVLNGPLRSMIRVKTMNWNTGYGRYAADQLYTAYANKSYSTCRVSFTEFSPTSNSVMFGCGIREIMSEVEVFQEDGIVVSMGKNIEIRIPDEDIGDEGLMVDFEGIALVVRKEFDPTYVNSNTNPAYRQIKGIEGNHILKIPVNENRTYEYMIAGGWSDGQVNKNAEEFREYVKIEALKYNHPIILGIQPLEVKI